MKKKIVASIVILLITFTTFYTNIVWAKTWQDYKNLSDNEWSTFFSQCYDKVINKGQRLTLEEEEKLALAMQNNKGNLVAQQVSSANDSLKSQSNNNGKQEMETKLADLKQKITYYCQVPDNYKNATKEQLQEYINYINEYNTLDSQYYNLYGQRYSPNFQSLTNQYMTELNNAIKDKQQSSSTSQGSTTAQGGSTSTTKETTPTKQHTLGEIIQESQDFIAAGEKAEEKISQTDLQKLSNTIYNILLVLGIVIAVILGGILGIKFITEGIEGQADVKKALVPYILGCTVVFGSFAIWKIVVNVLQSM